MRRGVVWAVAVLGVLVVAPAAAQERPVIVSLNGRMQFQWNSTSVEEEEAGATSPIPWSSFETRRVRLEANVTVEEWIRGIVEADFALGRLVLKHAYMALEFDPAFVVRAGQFKKPFSLIELRSSTQNAVIERGLRIRNLEQALTVARAAGVPTFRGGVVLPGEEYALLFAQNYISYDLGAELSGSYRALGWAAGVFNGSGADTRDENDAKQVAARVTVAPPLGTPLRLGAGFSHSEINWPTAADRRDGNAFEVDAELGGFRRGLWVLAEVTRGTNLATDGTFLGAQGVASYFVGTGGSRLEGFEPVARVSWGDPDDDIDDDAGLLVTPGINLYFFGRNRLMFNWDIYMAQNDAIDTHHAGRAQINLHF